MDRKIEEAQAELEMARSKLESEIAFHRAEHANAMGASTALHQEIAQLKADFSKLSDAEALSRSKVDELEKANDLLLKQIVELNPELEIVKNELENTKLALAEKNIELFNSEKLFENQISDSRALVKDIQLKLDSNEAELMTVKNEASNMNSEISNLKSDLDARTLELSIIKSELENVIRHSKPNDESSTLQNLKTQLAEAEIRIAGLQSDLSREIKRTDITKKVFEAKLAELEKK